MGRIQRTCPHRAVRSRPGRRHHPVAATPSSGAARAGPQVAFSRSRLTVKWSDAFASLLELAEACDVPTHWSCAPASATPAKPRSSTGRRLRPGAPRHARRGLRARLLRATAHGRHARSLKVRAGQVRGTLGASEGMLEVEAELERASPRLRRLARFRDHQVDVHEGQRGRERAEHVPEPGEAPVSVRDLVVEGARQPRLQDLDRD